MNTFITFITSLVSYLILDMVWLGVIIKPFNMKMLAPWVGDLKILPALGVYILLALGATFFVFPHVTNIGTAFAFGCLMGCIIYGVYDLTNYATIAKWPFMFLVVDWTWGTISGGLVAVITYTIVRFLK